MRCCEPPESSRPLRSREQESVASSQVQPGAHGHERSSRSIVESWHAPSNSAPIHATRARLWAQPLTGVSRVRGAAIRPFMSETHAGHHGARPIVVRWLCGTQRMPSPRPLGVKRTTSCPGLLNKIQIRPDRSQKRSNAFVLSKMKRPDYRFQSSPVTRLRQTGRRQSRSTRTTPAADRASAPAGRKLLGHAGVTPSKAARCPMLAPWFDPLA